MILILTTELFLFIYFSGGRLYIIISQRGALMWSCHMYINEYGNLVLTDNQKVLCEILHDIFITTQGIALKLSIKAHFGFKNIWI